MSGNAMETKKIIVAIDVDEVLAMFVDKLSDYHNINYGTELKEQHFHSYEFHKVWGGTQEEATCKINEFHQMGYLSKLNVVNGAKEALLKLKQVFSLHIVTARPNYSKDATKAWIDEHYPNIFDDIHFGNHYATDGTSRSKAEICHSIGASLLVDDSLKYAKNCATNGIPVVLFGHYPWNRPDTEDQHHFNGDDNTWMIKEAFTWEEAVELIFIKLGVQNQLKSMDISQKHSLKIAAIQMTSINDKLHNLQSIRRLVHEAVKEGAQFICLPECCVYMGVERTDILKVSENIKYEDTNTSVQYLCDIAASNSIWLSVGGFPEKIQECEDKVYNSHFIISPNGEIQNPIYRKIHLFDNPFTNLEESKTTVSGNAISIVDIGFAKIGVTVCYDLRFPELYSRICRPISESDGMGGAEIVLVPSAFTVPTGKAHWEILLRARAIENQVYVVAAAQSGRHNDKRESYGHSMIVDPWGTIVDERCEEGEGIVYATFDREMMENIRQKSPVWNHRKYNCYA